jgi:hypothetical protein
LTPIFQRKKGKRIQVTLIGGLGNQLFQYFAGQYLAHKSGGVLRVDPSLSQFGRSGHWDWINAVTLPMISTPSRNQYSLTNYKSVVKRKVRDFLSRFISSKDLQLRVLRQYQSPVLGFDPLLENVKPPVTITGYFQTWRYYQALNDKGLVSDIQMKSPSSWFREKLSELDSQGNVLGIHVRRGDYVGNSDIGTLSVSYYESALRDLRARGLTWDAIWIFSDDKELTEHEFKNFDGGGKNLHFVDPPKESHSFESMLLMSKCQSIVIANSTFSWWAATLGSPNKTIASPTKWFAQMADPEDLYPDSWIRVSSEWVDL